MATGDPLRLGIAGALGRMGRAVDELAAAHPELIVAARLDRAGAVDDPARSPPLAPLAEVLPACDVIIDFSTAAACAELATRAAANGGPALVIGATGSSSQEDGAIARAARSIAIVRSGNFSVGVTLLAALVEQAARRLSRADWDVEVLEAHHRGKVDAPSGTALLLARAAARGRNEALAEIAVPSRQGMIGERVQGAIGFSVMRGGGIVGEHSVVFAADDEILTLSHSARDRRLFARGALEAATWVRRQPPGLYDMLDVLGMRD